MFEFILAGDCEVLESISGQSIKRKESCIIFNKLYNIVAYQTWDAHTLVENNHIRRAFSINPFIFKSLIDNFNSQADKTDYKPSCVFRTADKDYFIVIKDIEILTSHRNSAPIKNKNVALNNFMTGKIKLIIENDFTDITINHHAVRVPKIPPGTYQDIDLNLSSVSYHDLENHSSDREFTPFDASPAPLFSEPYSGDSESSGTKPEYDNLLLNAIANPSYNSLPMEKSYNFIIREKCDVVKVNKNIYDIRIKSNGSFITAYEDWSKHSLSNFTHKRIIKHICPSEFTQLVSKYNNQHKITAFKELFKFKPTTFLEINGTPYLGVITDISMNHSTGTDAHELSLRFNTWQMRSITDRNLQYPSPTTDAKLYMNIDSTPTNNISSVLTNDLLIKVGLTAIVILEEALVVDTNIFYGFYNLLKFYAIPMTNIDTRIIDFYNLAKNNELIFDPDNSKSSDAPKQVNRSVNQGVAILSNLQKKLGIDDVDHIKEKKRDTPQSKQKSFNTIPRSSKYTKNIKTLTIFGTGISPSQSAAILGYTLLHFVFYLSYTRGMEYSVNGGSTTMQQNDNAFKAALRDYGNEDIKKEKDEFVLQMQSMITGRKPINSYKFNKTELSKMAAGVETSCNLAFTFINMLINKDIQINSLNNVTVNVPVSKYSSKGKGVLNIRNKPLSRPTVPKALSQLGRKLRAAMGSNGEAATYTRDGIYEKAVMPPPGSGGPTARHKAFEARRRAAIDTLNQPHLADPPKLDMDGGATIEGVKTYDLLDDMEGAAPEIRGRVYSVLETPPQGDILPWFSGASAITVPEGRALLVAPENEISEYELIPAQGGQSGGQGGGQSGGPVADYEPPPPPRALNDIVGNSDGYMSGKEVKRLVEAQLGGGGGQIRLPEGSIQMEITINGNQLLIAATPPEVLTAATQGWQGSLTGAVSSVSEGGKEYWSRDGTLSDVVVDDLLDGSNIKDALKDMDLKDTAGDPISEDYLDLLTDTIRDAVSEASFKNEIKQMDPLKQGRLRQSALIEKINKVIESTFGNSLNSINFDIDDFTINLIEKPLVKNFVKESMRAADSLRQLLNDLAAGPEGPSESDIANHVNDILNSDFTNSNGNEIKKPANSTARQDIIDIVNSTIISELGKALNVNKILDDITDNDDFDERGFDHSNMDASDLKRLLDKRIGELSIGDQLYENILTFSGLDPATTPEFSDLKGLCKDIDASSKIDLKRAITENNPTLINDITKNLEDAYKAKLDAENPEGKPNEGIDPIDPSKLEGKVQFEIEKALTDYVKDYYNPATAEGIAHTLKLMDNVQESFADLFFPDRMTGPDGNNLDVGLTNNFHDLYTKTVELYKLKAEFTKGRNLDQTDYAKVLNDAVSDMRSLYYKSLPTVEELKAMISDLLVENLNLGSFDQDLLNAIREPLNQKLNERFAENIKENYKSVGNEVEQLLKEKSALDTEYAKKVEKQMKELVDSIETLVEILSQDVIDGDLDPFKDAAFDFIP